MTTKSEHQSSGEPAAGEPPTNFAVLAVDDDRHYVDLVRVLLEGAGLKILTCTSPIKGLETLRHNPQDIGVLLLDFNMPVMNGAEMLQYVRKLNPQVKVIGLTGMSSGELPTAFSEGVDGLYSKPFKVPELVSAIRELATR